mgnify:CR=1 FL=1
MDILKPKFEKIYISGTQNASNIAKNIKRAILESDPASRIVAPKLKGKSKFLTCFNVYIYLRKNVKYVRESGSLQTAKTLPRIIYDKYGDCKHYTTFACSILNALGIKCFMRMVSQNYYDPNPTHIYCVAIVNGEEVIVDPCMKTFNNECQYKYKYNLKF